MEVFFVYDHIFRIKELDINVDLGMNVIQWFIVVDLTMSILTLCRSFVWSISDEPYHMVYINYLELYELYNTYYMCYM